MVPFVVAVETGSKALYPRILMTFMPFMCAFGVQALPASATLADLETNPRYLLAIATVSVTVA